MLMQQQILNLWCQCLNRSVETTVQVIVLFQLVFTHPCMFTYCETHTERRRHSFSTWKHINTHALDTVCFHSAMQATGRGNATSCGRMGGGGSSHWVYPTACVYVYSILWIYVWVYTVLLLLSQGLLVHINLQCWHNLLWAVPEAANASDLWCCEWEDLCHGPHSPLATVLSHEQ